jgi:hypothetical protein
LGTAVLFVAGKILMARLITGSARAGIERDHLLTQAVPLCTPCSSSALGHSLELTLIRAGLLDQRADLARLAVHDLSDEWQVLSRAR